MEKDQHEKYEYARRRLKQKKRLYYHFVLLLLVIIFALIATQVFSLIAVSNWQIWAITFWLFLFGLHFIKVFITDRFMNKNWERDQIDRLVELQNKKIAQLESQIDQKNNA